MCVGEEKDENESGRFMLCICPVMGVCACVGPTQLKLIQAELHYVGSGAPCT